MISKNMARCLAKICGDGELNHRYIRYNNTCKELLDEFEEDIKKEFGNIHLTRGEVNSGTSFIQIQRKDVLNVFKNHLASFKSYNIMIPESVNNSNIDIKIAFLRAFYDDEGCATLRLNNNTNEWKRNVTLTSNSLRIILEIKEILLLVGIFSNKIYRNKPLSNYDKTFVLSITGKNNFILFKKIIGFHHPRKIKMLELIIHSYNSTPIRHKKNFLYLKKDLTKL